MTRSAAREQPFTVREGSISSREVDRFMANAARHSSP
jgi:hypothetical protein